MSAILAIESSTLFASVALQVGESQVIERTSAVKNHTEKLLPMVDECLTEAGLSLTELDAIAVGAGPGSFTGLRIGMATAKGLCFSTGVPLIALSSLAASAYGALPFVQSEELLLSVLDARRKEVFFGLFEPGSNKALAPESVCRPEELGEALAEMRSTLSGHNAASRPLCVFGSGAEQYEELIKPLGRVEPQAPRAPSARALAALAAIYGENTGVAIAAPAYVRLPEAQLKYPNGIPGGTFAARKLRK